MAQMNLCKNCVYWREIEGEEGRAAHGSCQRFPPTLVASNMSEDDPEDWVLPVTWFDHWCGEFQQAPC